jgi:adenine C2-methylase RlmN of 23S rRNA A2503 and tRNA A37
LMSGNAFILAIDNDKLWYLQSKGFWILNTDRDIEDIYHMASNDFESFKNLIKDNSSKMINNQRILYDWYYKDNNFKMNTIKWMLGEI